MEQPLDRLREISKGKKMKMARGTKCIEGSITSQCLYYKKGRRNNGSKIQ